MKSIVLAAALLLAMPAATAQQPTDITGAWSGVLEVQGTQLRLVFHIAATEEGYSATFDSPDQGGKDIPVAKTTFVDAELTLEMKNIGATYTGTLEDGVFDGTFEQGLQSLPLKLSRDEAVLERKRPQEPSRPYSYGEEAVSVKNISAEITLAGTLTLPATPGPHPAVVLISGSGPQNRDEEVFGHRPFLVLADHLTRQGIAVLRFDDRGVGESTGDFSTATSLDFASDAASIVAYLKTRADIDTARIGLIGHSEGGIVAPMVAARFEDISFMVLLAGMGVTGSELSLEQARSMRGYEVSDEEAYARFTRKLVDIAASTVPLDDKRAALAAHYRTIEPVLRTMLPEGVPVDAFIAQRVERMSSPWQQFFVMYDPAVDLEKISIPVLSLSGSRDVQIVPGPNQAAIAAALRRAGNPDVVIRELPGLNHMFQECATCTMTEYPRLEQTFSPVALAAISDWINARIGS